MSSAKKKKQNRSKDGTGGGRASPKASGHDPLDAGLKTLAAGDYPEARKRFRALAESGTLNEADRRRAEDLIEATKLDGGTLWTALACAGFFGVAIAVGIAVQP